MLIWKVVCWRQRIPDLLIVCAAQNVAWLEHYLTTLKDVTSVIVSHDSGFLDHVCQSIIHYEPNRKLRIYIVSPCSALGCLVVCVQSHLGIVLSSGQAGASSLVASILPHGWL